MSGYRLHIDIPLGDNEKMARYISKQIMHWMFDDVDARARLRALTMGADQIEQVNYRLGHDDDRQKSNYLDKNENGHVSNKKIKLDFTGTPAMTD